MTQRRVWRREDCSSQVHHGLHLQNIRWWRQSNSCQECCQVFQSSPGSIWKCQNCAEQQFLKICELTRQLSSRNTDTLFIGQVCRDSIQCWPASWRTDFQFLVGEVPGGQPECWGEELPHLLPDVPGGRPGDQGQLWHH